MSKDVVTVKNYGLTLGGKQIVDDLNFTVRSGEVFAFLGSNGSGKTSTIRSLLGVYPTSKGELLVNGEEFHPAMSKDLGYLPEERGLYARAKVLDTMMYFGQLKGMSYSEARTAALDYLKEVELEDKAHVKLSKLSGGQQQKIQLGVAFMNQPKLVILDEPTKGFDPVNRKLLIDRITKMKQDGAAIIYITHLMEEVERLADRVLIIKNGQQRAYGTVDEVRSAHGETSVHVRFSGKLPKEPKHFTVTKQETNYAELAPTKSDAYDAVLDELTKTDGLSLRYYEVAQPTIEDVFVNVYQQKEARHV